MIRMKKHYYGLLTLLITTIFLVVLCKFKDKSLLEFNIFYLQQGNNLFLNVNNNPVESHRFNLPEPYRSRRLEMLENCQKSVFARNHSQLNHVLVDERNRILFCYVPKVACTNWKKIFMVLTGKLSSLREALNLPASAVHTHHLFPTLQNYTGHKVSHFLRDYTKIIFVRNPLERLLSAFRNKLEKQYNSSKYFQSRFGKFIVRNFRKNPTNISLETGNDVKFLEFVQYVVSSDRMLFNEHWNTMTDLCAPCFLRYDIIGKFETLQEDAAFVFHWFRLNMSFPVLPNKPETTQLLKDYYRTLPEHLLRALFEIYHWDFRLFGYDFKNTLGL